MTLNIILDMVVAGLLLATIAYAVLLSRRLGALRSDKQQLETLVRSLDQSAQRAAAGIAGLKEAAERVGHQLQQKIDQGGSLKSDLTYIIDLGGGLADRIEGGIRARRDDARQPTAPAPEAPTARTRRPSAGERSIEAPPSARSAAAGAASAASPRVADFPSRAERLLRGALEARR